MRDPTPPARCGIAVFLVRLYLTAEPEIHVLEAMLRFDSVSFAYRSGSEPVVGDVSLKIDSGERVAVMGDNGSGKTTFALLAAGLLAPTSGTIERSDPNHYAGLVLQNPDNQIVSISVEHELAFPLECRQVPTSGIRDSVDRTLADFSFGAKRQVSPNDLSGGEKQKLALASALIAGPDLLVLDEPTSHLDLRGRELLHKAIAGISSDRPELATIMVTQSSSEALRFSRLIVMRDGRIVADGRPEEILLDREVTESCGLRIPNELLMREIDDSLLPAPDSASAELTSSGKQSTELMRLAGLCFGWKGGPQVLRGLDLSIGESSILGIAAGSGEGKTTLGYLLAGLISPSDGSVCWRGTEQLAPALLKRVSYLFQFPERQMFESTVRDEIAFGLRQTGASEDLIDERVRSSLEIVGIRHEVFSERSPHHLSGGEMRKVALASIIALNRPLIFYDEPTAELDAKSIRLLKGTLRKAKAAGTTQIVASHDTDFLYEVCDDILVLRDGMVMLAGDKFDYLDRPEILEECGLSVPGLLGACRSERMRGFVRSNRLESLEELLNRLKQIA